MKWYSYAFIAAAILVVVSVVASMHHDAIVDQIRLRLEMVDVEIRILNYTCFSRHMNRGSLDLHKLCDQFHNEPEHVKETLRKRGFPSTATPYVEKISFFFANNHSSPIPDSTKDGTHPSSCNRHYQDALRCSAASRVCPGKHPSVRNQRLQSVAVACPRGNDSV